jgi:hypothetical protein
VEEAASLAVWAGAVATITGGNAIRRFVAEHG